MSDKSEINLGFLYIEVFRVTLSQPLSINFVAIEISFMPHQLKGGQSNISYIVDWFNAELFIVSTSFYINSINSSTFLEL